MYFNIIIVNNNVIHNKITGLFKEINNLELKIIDKDSEISELNNNNNNLKNEIKLLNEEINRKNTFIDKKIKELKELKSNTETYNDLLYENNMLRV